MMGTPLVSIRDVRKSFGAFEALAGVSLDVATGEVLCVIGASGSGKTTLLRCVNQLVEIDAGAIFVDGEQEGRLHVTGLSKTSEPFVMGEAIARARPNLSKIELFGRAALMIADWSRIHP
jgi:ABC-type polar amino acid transport system ATPase subunit